MHMNSMKMLYILPLRVPASSCEKNSKNFQMLTVELKFKGHIKCVVLFQPVLSIASQFYFLYTLFLTWNHICSIYVNSVIKTELNRKTIPSHFKYIFTFRNNAITVQLQINLKTQSIIRKLDKLTLKSVHHIIENLHNRIISNYYWFGKNILFRYQLCNHTRNLKHFQNHCTRFM